MATFWERAAQSVDNLFSFYILTTVIFKLVISHIGFEGVNVFTALKGTLFYILIVVTAAGAVPCGGPCIVHSAFYILLLVL